VRWELRKVRSRLSLQGIKHQSIKQAVIFNPSQLIPAKTKKKNKENQKRKKWKKQKNIKKSRKKSKRG
jgi:hypothetical protein